MDIAVAMLLLSHRFLEKYCCYQQTFDSQSAAKSIMTVRLLIWHLQISVPHLELGTQGFVVSLDGGVVPLSLRDLPRVEEAVG